MKLMRGINLGGYLSQCQHSDEHHETFITKEDIARIAEWGFDHIRIPIDYEVFEEEDGTSKESGFAIVERAVQWGLEYQLEVILDLHKAYGYDFNDAGNAEKNNLFTSIDAQNRFIELWKKIATRYGKYEGVAFELLNEVVEMENADAWNALIKRTVTEIRKIHATKPIIYGGIQWNSVKTIKLLEKPMDENIILTFHFYEPKLFTHQHAHWTKAKDLKEPVHYPGELADYRRMAEEIDDFGDVLEELQSKAIDKTFLQEMMQEAIDAAADLGAKLYCGEYGTIDQAPVEDTLRWYQDTDAVFRENNIGCAVWTYRDMDFGILMDHYASIKDELIQLWTK